MMLSGGGYQLLASAKDIHSKSMFSYLIMMSVRLLEIRRILKPSGSVYLHCDPTAGHYLKLVMDGIFGKNNFRNEIVWAYPASPSPVKNAFPRKHDTILRYTKTEKYTFNADAVRVPYSEASLNRSKYVAKSSTVMSGTKIKLQDKGKIPSTVWVDIQQAYRYRKDYQNYPTQKPLPLLERVIKASSNKGDIIFDPFCGCATTLVAAENLGREWVGIDISPKAIELVKARIGDHQGVLRDITCRTDVPKRTDIGDELSYSQRKAYKKHLYGIQDGFCNGCQEHFQARNLEMDHIMPVAQGGTNHESNFQLLCGYCNKVKGDKPQQEFRAILHQHKPVNTDWIDTQTYQSKVLH